MSQHSEERLPHGAPAGDVTPPSARILPFERPQSDLQRAIQLRAQEALDRDRERDREGRRPQPLKWLVVFAIAAIPVLLIFAGVDAFLRAFHQANETYNTAPAAAQQPPAEWAEPLPAAPSSEPGVVILQPFEPPAASERGDQPNAADRSGAR